MGRKQNHPQGTTSFQLHQPLDCFDFRGIVEREDQGVVSRADDLSEHGVQSIGKDMQYLGEVLDDGRPVIEKAVSPTVWVGAMVDIGFELFCTEFVCVVDL